MATAAYGTGDGEGSSVRVVLGVDGTATVQPAVHDIGTGMYRVMTQMASRTLGMPMSTVAFFLGDSLFPADNLTPTLMELGGKNPFIIFGDADLDSALPWAIEGGFFNQGEACTAASRVLVQADIHDEVVRRYADAVPRLRVGNGADPGTHIGPMVTAAHRKRVLDYLDIGIKEGATVAAAAALPGDPELAGGFYVPPTLLTGVRPDMRIAREEIFGPCRLPPDSISDSIPVGGI